MFGNWALSLPTIPVPVRLSKDVGANDKDNILEIIFPMLDIESFHDPSFCSDSKKMGLCALFHSLRKFPDVTPEHLRSLNISYQHNVPVDEFLPPRKQDANSNDSIPSSWFPVEGGETQTDQTFRDRKRELLIKNEHAYESLARMRRDIKLGHFYKFYQSLELVNTYYSESEGAIAGMPEKFREDVIKNLIEPICWMFNARLSPPKGPPRVQLQKARFLTRIDLFAYLTPALPAERKQGLVEGPLFGVQCRHEDYFIQPRSASPEPSSSPRQLPSVSPETDPPAENEPKQDDDGDVTMKEGKNSEVDKLTKEETKNEDKELESSSESATAPKSEITSEKKELTEEEKRKAARRQEEKEIRMKKGSWQEGDVWDAIKEIGGLLMVAQDRRKGGKGDTIGKGKVEKNIRYRAIGREDHMWDDIYLICSLHHHISFSHLRISSAYLRFLETGNLPNPEHPLIKNPNSEWYELKVGKTQWFDIFKGEDRVEIARLAAGILKYLSRNERADI